MDRRFVAMAIAVIGCILATNAAAQVREQQEAEVRTQNQGAGTGQRVQTQTQEQIYGSQLMTQQERNEYRNRMGAATSQEERERVRAEHHTRMQERAKQRGVTLPDQPPQRGMGGGMGPGMGGMGPGGGMGPSKGGGR